MMEDQIKDQINLAEIENKLNEARGILSRMYKEALNSGILADNVGVVGIMADIYDGQLVKFQELCTRYGKELGRRGEI